MKSILKKAVTGAALAASLCGSLQAAWYEDVTFKGDFRYRLETIEDKDGARDRVRHRLRLRYGAYGKVNDSIDYGIRLATGSTSDPVSTNQTLGGDSANKAFNLDLAYVGIEAFKNSKLTFGKMKNVFSQESKDQLIFDGDFTPEGIAFEYDMGSFYSNVAYMFFESDRRVQNNAVGNENEGMAGIQLGYADHGLNIGLAYYDFELSFDNEITFTAGVPNSTLRHDYNLVHAFAEYTTKIGAAKTMFYAGYLNNTGTESAVANDDQDTAFSLGVKTGFGNWKLGLEYKEVEANALPRYNANGDEFAIADSDFGDGDTDVEGFKFSAGYKFMKNSEIAATYFLNEQAASGAGTDYDRLQVDLKFKF